MEVTQHLNGAHVIAEEEEEEEEGDDDEGEYVDLIFCVVLNNRAMSNWITTKCLIAEVWQRCIYLWFILMC